MTDEIPITVGVWAKRPGTGAGWGKVSEIRTWRDLTFDPRHNQPGTWSMRVAYDGQALKLDKTHVLTFDYRGTRMTGLVEKTGPRSDETGKPMLEVSGPGALALLGDALCWPAPSVGLLSPGVAYYIATGAAETVLRDIIIANLVTRRGDEVTVPESLGRGASVSLHERFTNLLEVVLAKCEVAGLGVRMGLVDTTSSTRAEMRVEFYVPTDKSNRVRLSHKVGTLRTWSQEDNAPTGTQAIVGGGGRGASRTYKHVIDTDSQTAWGRKRELFVDARDTSDMTILTERGTEALREATGQSAFELEAVEAEGMRFAEHFNLGDQVAIELLDSVRVVDQLRGVTISGSADSGVTVKLLPGNPDAVNPLFGQAAITRGIRRQVQALERREDS